MTLRQGDSGPAVKGLQRNLNKLGSILLVDGDFGPGTRDAVVDARVMLKMPGNTDADDQLQAAVAAVPDPFPKLTAAGATFIARLEVGSPRQYRLRYCHPVWPGETSGITIGIGYDLRYTSRAKFEADWGANIPPATIDRLAAAFGLIGTEQLRTALCDLDIPLGAAMTVFLQQTLPEFHKLTQSIYPQIDAVPPARRTALVSLVYNRGTDLAGDRRREMRAIQTLLAAGDFEPIAAEFDAMERLWDPAKAGGLIQRRHDEAKLWRSGFGALQLE